ncbi:helix-turn-helix transcriptional regulator [Haliangium ochraceum]|uniref:Transcriptional regulator, XRE family n=1 Tax=Haliangium ochraceum (strain DSM 14365 / JCM 11303 / SMP-2) TaxID=502025 RepID=D0LUH6_HALO1|nr:helix-turn-helix transcriptional regulator [Haliangium ochraceum]ACY19299.1 transcriptional regulator, XRE family [Haliangium ochraceum DSM 14365]
MKKQRTQELTRTLSKQLAKARSTLDVTQEEAAERIGITVEYYARIERGKALPSLLTFAQISVALEVSTESLLGLGEITQRSVSGLPAWFSPPQQEESKQLRRLFRRLRQVPPEVLSAVESVVKQLERFIENQRKRSSRSDGDDE